MQGRRRPIIHRHWLERYRAELAAIRVFHEQSRILDLISEPTWPEVSRNPGGSSRRRLYPMVMQQIARHSGGWLPDNLFLHMRGCIPFDPATAKFDKDVPVRHGMD